MIITIKNFKSSGLVASKILTNSNIITVKREISLPLIPLAYTQPVFLNMHFNETPLQKLNWAERIKNDYFPGKILNVNLTGNSYSVVFTVKLEFLYFFIKFLKHS